ncbi:putative protein EIN4-like [Capsicum annuum]|nr:putative protein EIN4-like [Capsicum annuum]
MVKVGSGKICDNSFRVEGDPLIISKSSVQYFQDEVPPIFVSFINPGFENLIEVTNNETGVVGVVTDEICKGKEVVLKGPPTFKGSAVWSSRPFDRSFGGPGSGIPLSLDPGRMDFGSVSLYAFLPSSGVERPLAGLGTFLAMKLMQEVLTLEYQRCQFYFVAWLGHAALHDLASLAGNMQTIVPWHYDCGFFVAEYSKYLSEGLVVPSNGFDGQTHHLRYATLLWNYGTVKARKIYTNNNDDPSRSRPSYVLPLDDAMMVSLE